MTSPHTGRLETNQNEGNIRLSGQQRHQLYTYMKYSLTPARLGITVDSAIRRYCGPTFYWELVGKNHIVAILAKI